MKVYGKHYRTIWLNEVDPNLVQIIDQRPHPHVFAIEDFTMVDEVVLAIKEISVRGAGLIGATACSGMYIAALHDPRDSEIAFMDTLVASGEKLKATRPTAVNLRWAVKRQLEAIQDIEGNAEKFHNYP